MFNENSQHKTPLVDDDYDADQGILEFLNSSELLQPEFEIRTQPTRTHKQVGTSAVQTLTHTYADA